MPAAGKSFRARELGPGSLTTAKLGLLCGFPGSSQAGGGRHTTPSNATTLQQQQIQQSSSALGREGQGDLWNARAEGAPLGSDKGGGARGHQLAAARVGGVEVEDLAAAARPRCTRARGQGRHLLALHQQTGGSQVLRGLGAHGRHGTPPPRQQGRSEG